MKDEPIGFSKPQLDRSGLGDRLRMAREYVGLSQEEVSKYLEIPRSALSNIEGGQRRVDAIELTKLAKLYQRPMTWFTGEDTGSNLNEELPAEVAHLARAASALSQQDRQELARFADFLRSRAKAKASDENG